MQTTAISVVSDIRGFRKLEAIRDFIEDQDSYYTIDMTSAVQLKEGNYPDCIVAKTAPILLPPDPLIPLPQCMQDMISSQTFHIVSGLVVLLAVPMFPGSLLLSSPSNRELAFVVSVGAMILVYGLHVLMFRGNILKLVFKGFDFWYLSGFQAVACISGGYLYATAGVRLTTVVVMFTLYQITHSLFAFGIDASPWSTRVRSCFMIFWAVTYAVIAIAARFAEDLYAEDVYKDFVSLEINLIVAQMTPRQGMLTTLITLILFFVKYAVLMWWGTEYVTIWFEAHKAVKEVGEIKKDVDSGRKQSLFRINSSINANDPDGGINSGRRNSGQPPNAHLSGNNVHQVPASLVNRGRARSIVPAFHDYTNAELMKSLDKSYFDDDCGGDEDLKVVSLSQASYYQGNSFANDTENGATADRELSPGDDADTNPLWSHHSPNTAAAAAAATARRRSGGGATNNRLTAANSSTFGPLNVSHQSGGTASTNSGYFSPPDSHLSPNTSRMRPRVTFTNNNNSRTPPPHITTTAATTGYDSSGSEGAGPSPSLMRMESVTSNDCA